MKIVNMFLVCVIIGIVFSIWFLVICSDSPVLERLDCNDVNDVHVITNSLNCPIHGNLLASEVIKITPKDGVESVFCKTCCYIELQKYFLAHTPRLVSTDDYNAACDMELTLKDTNASDIQLSSTGTIAFDNAYSSTINICNILKFSISDSNGVAEVKWLSDPNKTEIDNMAKWFFDSYLKDMCDNYIRTKGEL